MTTDPTATFRKALAEAKNVIVIAGAGLSAGSGAQAGGSKLPIS